MPGDSRKTSVTRGTLMLMAGQVVFLISGYAVNILLAYKLEGEEYGRYGFIMTLLLWVELFVINGIPTAMQKYLPTGQFDAAGLIRMGQRKQVMYTLVVFTAALLVAPLIARVFDDSTLSPLFRIAAIDIVLYGMYWFYAGVLGGQHRFQQQAVAAIAYPIGKLVSIAALVFSGYGVAGALVGNWLGSILGMVAGAWYVRSDLAKQSPAVDFAAIRRFAVPIVLFTISVNFLLNVDFFFVKRMLQDQDVSHYFNASTLARIPYLVFLALSFTLLPVLSEAIAARREEQVRRQIRQVLRLLMIVLTPVLLFLWQNAEATVLLLYPERFRPAADILPFLTLAMTLFTYFYIIETVINADARPGLAFGIAVAAVAVDAAVNYLLVPLYGTQGAALGTCAGSAAGILIGGAWLRRRFQDFIPWDTVLRIAVVSALTTAVFAAWPVSPVLVVPKGLAFVGFYFVAVLVVREMDLPELRALLSKS